MGIGAAFARRLAASGLHLVLVANEPRSLHELAAELRTRHGVEVMALEAELGSLEGIERVREACASREIGLLVYNAAVSFVGRSLEQDDASRLRQLHVNCRAPLLLAMAQAEAMVGRGRGGIVLMSSLTGLHGFPGVSTYAATKAFALVLGESLWGELRPHGVDVLAVCPGPTDTPGLAASSPRFGWPSAPVMSSEAVVDQSLAALGRRPQLVPGRINRAAAALLLRVLPRPWAVWLAASNLRRAYPSRLG